MKYPKIILDPQNNATPNPNEMGFDTFIIPKENLSTSMDRNRRRRTAITRMPKSKKGYCFRSIHQL